MDKKQWIITGILIIVVAVVAFNFNNWTGKATTTVKDSLLPAESKIIITPASVTAGEEITITIKPARDPKTCLESTIEFYKLKDDGSLGLRTATKDISNTLGTRRNCDTVVITTYKTGSNWEGSYAATVEDRATKEKVKSNTLIIT